MSETLLYLKNKDVREAEKWIKKAIEADRENNMVFHLGKDYIIYSKILKKKNNLKNAKEMLNRAISIMQTSGAHGWAEKYDKELADI